MNSSEGLCGLFKAAFPHEPRPVKFFARDTEDLSDLDIPQELNRRIAGRLWTDITLLDWRMTGTSPMIARRYLVPATFVYYVPSIILGVSGQIEFVDYALEAILPDNKRHAPRGEWWFEFEKAFSPPQKAALSAFLSHARKESWDRIGPAIEPLFECAEEIWSA